MMIAKHASLTESKHLWLGPYPSHWLLGKTAWYFEIAMGETILREDLVDEGELPVFSATDGDQYFGTVKTAKVRLEYGDIVIPARGNSIGSVKMVKEPATTTQTTIYCRNISRDKLLPEYVYYFFVGCKKQLFHFTQTAIPQITVEEVATNPILLPPLPEQRSIAAFLDAETSKIDALVAEQRRLIELLKEKRQAVISHAVTKGLNPHVKMKPSGIDWLGDVPEHWEISKLKWFCTLQRGYDLTKDECQAGDIPVVTSAGITGTHSSAMAKGPGVVTGRYGTTGEVFYVEGSFWPHNTTLFVLEFYKNLPRYVWYYLQVINLSSHSAKSAVPGIDRNDIHVITIAYPAIDEQKLITAKLDSTLREYDALILEAECAIALLQERRTALISAAVTGKIDVRSFVQKDASA